MSYQTIVVHLDHSEHCAARTRVATRLALQFDAHLVGVYALDGRIVPGEVQSAYMANVMVERMNYVATNPEQVAQAFQQETSHLGLASAEFRSTIGDSVALLSMHARYADLLVIGQTDPDEHATGVTPTFPELMVLAAGRPVLVVPYYAADFPKLGGRVMVAWNASREATRALTDALPILKRAQQVVILAVNPREGGKHGDVPSADIALYLARHGVQAEAMQTFAAEIEAGDALLARASDLDIDLLVMGGYGHSRLRELVLGGVTQSMLNHMTVPVFMSH